jgi:hypothetical protein
MITQINVAQKGLFRITAVRRFAEWKYCDYVLLATFVLINYFPIAFFVASLKNDATQINLPVKLYFSEWLRKGVVPLWNPYLHGGFPVYADPGFAFWNPITWIFSLIGYNAYTFQWETIVYIFIGTVGFYKLGKFFNCGREGSLLMGCLYSASGFVVGSLEFTNYLTAGAFFPFCMLFISATISQQNSINAWYLAVSAFFLVNAGHPAIPVGAFYFLACYAGVFIIREKKIDPDINLFSISRRLLIGGGLLFVFLLPYLYSMWEVLPYFTRFSAQPSHSSIEFTRSQGFPYILTSLISPLMPNGGNLTKLVIYRTSFVSLLAVGIIIIGIRNGFRRNLVHPLLVILVFSILWLLPGKITLLLGQYLPGLGVLINFFPFRLFLVSVIIMLTGVIYGGVSITLTCKQLRRRSGTTSTVILILTFIFILAGTYLISLYKSQKDSDAISPLINFNLPVSAFLFILIYSFLALVFTLWRKLRWILFITLLLEILIFSWLTLPVNGISRTSPEEIESVISEVTNRQTIPSLVAISPPNDLPIRITKHIGNWSWYNEGSIQPDRFNYPSSILNTDSLKSFLAFYGTRPFVFMKQSALPLRITEFSPNHIKFDIFGPGTDTLQFLQNNYPGWEGQQDGKLIKPLSGNFLAFPIGATIDRSINFRFKKPVLGVLSMFSLLVLILSRIILGKPVKWQNQGS